MRHRLLLVAAMLLLITTIMLFTPTQGAPLTSAGGDVYAPAVLNAGFGPTTPPAPPANIPPTGEAAPTAGTAASPAPAATATATATTTPSPTATATSTATSTPTATATSTPTPTATATSTPTATPTPTTTPSPTSAAVNPQITRLRTGYLGYTDSATHQIVRTSSDRVYIFAEEAYQPYIRALRATASGKPAGFAEADATHRATEASAIWAVDAAIDGRDVVHILSVAEGGPVVYRTFDTTTNTWGGRVEIANSPWPNRVNGIRQGATGISIVLDAAGTAHVVYTRTQSGLRRIYYNNNQGGNWSHEALLDDRPANDNSHPTLAFGGDGALYAAWISDNGTSGSIRVRARRNGAWGAVAEVDANAYRNDGFALDQGPSLLVTPNGKLHIVSIGPYEAVAGSPTGYEFGRLRHWFSSNGATWTSDDPPLRYSHSPSLATDPQGNLYLFAHREDYATPDCADMYVAAQPAGGRWESWRVFASGCFDSSVTARWAQYGWNNPSVIDIGYWTQKGPNGEADQNSLYYAEIRGGLSAIRSLSLAPGP